MSFRSGPPPRPPHLKPTFLRGGCGGGGGKNIETPPPFLCKIINLLVWFDFEPKKCFRVPTPWGLYEVEWDERFLHFSFLLFRRVRQPWRPRGAHSKGCMWGCRDSICLLGYQMMFFAIFGLWALRRAGPNPCQTRKVTVSTNNGLHE